MASMAWMELDFRWVEIHEEDLKYHSHALSFVSLVMASREKCPCCPMAIEWPCIAFRCYVHRDVDVFSRCPLACLPVGSIGRASLVLLFCCYVVRLSLADVQSLVKPVVLVDLQRYRLPASVRCHSKVECYPPAPGTRADV